MMHPTLDHRKFVSIYPLHAVLLAGMLPLFLGALLSDIAYSTTYEVQWANFSSWLIVGAMILCGFVLLWAAVDLLRSGRRERQSWLYVALLSACFVLGFIGALIHSKDAWATMPAGLMVSVIVALIAVAATWVGFWGVGQVPTE